MAKQPHGQSLYQKHCEVYERPVETWTLYPVEAYYIQFEDSTLLQRRVRWQIPLLRLSASCL